MAVSKRTRYEVMKRDNFTCRYCRRADLPLTIDHVIPVALGGTDKPDNLVAACVDCNAGKSSSAPDAALVDDARETDVKWAGALKRVAAARARQRKRREAYVDRFIIRWGDWQVVATGERVPKPHGWQSTIERFYELGVPTEEIEDCVRIACSNVRVDPSETFRYFAGCVWRVVTEMQESAKELLDAEGVRADGS